jgi:hypothetical protein
LVQLAQQVVTVAEVLILMVNSLEVVVLVVLVAVQAD